MVKCHHLQLRSPPPLFHNFKWLNIKAAAAHHPIIQKEVDELLAKGAIEQSSGGSGFYSNVFVVLKHTGGFWSILNLQQFNCYVLIQHHDYAFFIDLKDAYLHIPIVKHYHCFFMISLEKVCISVKRFSL